MRIHLQIECLLLTVSLFLSGCGGKVPDASNSFDNESIPSTASSSTIKATTNAEGIGSTDGHDTTTSSVPITTNVVTLSSTGASTTVSTTTKGAKTSSTTSDSQEGSTTGITTKTPSAFTTKFEPEDFHTEIEMTIDKEEYSLDETIVVDITNNSGRTIDYGPQYIILRQTDADGWEMLYDKIGTHTISYSLGDGGTRKGDGVKLSRYDLEADQSYKLVLCIEDKWIGADFCTVNE